MTNHKSINGTNSNEWQCNVILKLITWIGIQQHAAASGDACPPVQGSDLFDTRRTKSRCMRRK